VYLSQWRATEAGSNRGPIPNEPPSLGDYAHPVPHGPEQGDVEGGPQAAQAAVLPGWGAMCE
jgi:hypothetical protein